MPYIIIGIIIIIIIIILYFFAYPAIFLIKSNNINGYWVDISGRTYKINSTGYQSFDIILYGIKNTGKLYGTIFNNTIKININTNIFIGIVNLKTNTIIFNNGVEWYKTSSE